MKNFQLYKILLIGVLFMATSCSEDFLDLDPRGTDLESNFYQTEDEMFQALVAAYDPLSWQGTDGWTMKLGLMNAASDDTYAGGSDASDQPNWVALDNFTLDPFIGPQSGFWRKGFAGIYRCNLFLQKIVENEFDPSFVARTTAEIKFLRAYYYFDLVRLFGNVPLFTSPISPDDISTTSQASPAEIYAQIEADLNDARNTFELPSTLPPDEFGRITKGAATALLGKVILYQNNEGRMMEAANLFEEIIGSGLYGLEDNFEDIFRLENEFGIESVFEIQHSGNQRGGWENFNNGTEGNYNVQFFGMRDYVGPDFATGWSFCPVSLELVDAMRNDPRFSATVINGGALQNQGASYTPGFQNTDFFIRKYAGLQNERALDGEPALNWATNEREIRYADILLMAAEAIARGGGSSADAIRYVNQVRLRVGLQPFPPLQGQALLDAIYDERRMELATEGHRFFDLVRTGRAAEVLGSFGFQTNKNEILPIPQFELDISEGSLTQNPGY